MIKSMTGFGKAQVEVGEKLISIGIKSLNSKSLDFNLKSPGIYREKELEIRNICANQLKRGKVELNLFIDSESTESNFSLNKNLFNKYYKELSDLAHELNDDADIFSIVSRFPDVLKATNESLTEKEWLAIKLGIEEALENLDQFRITEGSALHGDIEKRVYLIAELLKSISKLEYERTQAVRDRITKNLEERVGSNINEDRFEQELIYYLEKLDITEETTRLNTHCNYFLETMKLEEATGKKLGFISQEIGREINTIGSKANHAEIQKIVVQMKDELEKIKEQLLNVL